MHTTSANTLHPQVTHGVDLCKTYFGRLYRDGIMQIEFCTKLNPDNSSYHVGLLSVKDLRKTDNVSKPFNFA